MPAVSASQASCVLPYAGARRGLAASAWKADGRWLETKEAGRNAQPSLMYMCSGAGNGTRTRDPLLGNQMYNQRAAARGHRIPGAGDGIRTRDVLLGRQGVGGDIEGSNGNSVATPLPRSWHGQFALSMLQLPSSTPRRSSPGPKAVPRHGQLEWRRPIVHGSPQPLRCRQKRQMRDGTADIPACLCDGHRMTYARG